MDSVDGHPHSDASKLSYLVVSGGTGANSFASAFGPSPAFVLPVSDDGGSSAEILRCFGGPSIGDIRESASEWNPARARAHDYIGSRLIRLIPILPTQTTKEDRELQAIYNLMAYRFPADVSEKTVRGLWEEVVEGRGELWDGIGEDKKECIRGQLPRETWADLQRSWSTFKPSTSGGRTSAFPFEISV